MDEIERISFARLPADWRPTGLLDDHGCRLRFTGSLQERFKLCEFESVVAWSS